MCPECAAGKHMECQSVGNGKVCGGPHDAMMASLTTEYNEEEAEPGGSMYAWEKADKLRMGSGGIGGGMKSLLSSLGVMG